MRIGLPLFALSLALLGSPALLASRPAQGGENPPAAAHAMAGMPGMGALQATGGAMAMSDADMADMARRYWAAHPPEVPQSNVPLAATAVSDTVTVENFIFDFDGNLATQIDTVKIALGDQVVWKWLNGTHTVTSGTGTADPTQGSHFNAPMDLTHLFFTMTFDTAGTYPYFCTFHDFLNMKGVVVVQDLTGVSGGPIGTGIGFASHPWPNPARGAVSFRYDVREAGRVRAEVLDVRGRMVAVVLDETQGPGRYLRAWDGRTRGAAAPAGRYFLRLTLPGYAGTQAVTLTR